MIFDYSESFQGRCQFGLLEGIYTMNNSNSNFIHSITWTRKGGELIAHYNSRVFVLIVIHSFSALKKSPTGRVQDRRNERAEEGIGGVLRTTQWVMSVI